jgi:hypothetical protein
VLLCRQQRLAWQVFVDSVEPIADRAAYRGRPYSARSVTPNREPQRHPIGDFLNVPVHNCFNSSGGLCPSDGEWWKETHTTVARVALD